MKTFIKYYLKLKFIMLGYLVYAILFFLGLVSSSCSTVASQKEDKPNIIFLMIDDCSAVEFSCYATADHPSGNETPVIDKLANEGLRFTTCWASPLCKPARAMLMTGKYASKTGIYGNQLSKSVPNYLGVHKPISKVMQENGYETAISGKWHLPGAAAQEEYGWDSYSLLGGYMTPYKKDIVWDGLWFSWKEASKTFHDKAVIGKNDRKYPALYWNGVVIENGELLPSDSTTYAPDLCQKFVVDFIKADRDKPFFLYYPMVLPHDPWFGTPNPLNPGKRTSPGFNSQIDRVEYYVQELVEMLKKEDVYDNTIVFLTADNATLANGKGSCSEFGVRVPLIVFGGPLKAKGVSEVMVDFTDMYPTILETAGINVSEMNDLDGISFNPVLRNEKFIGKEFVFSFLDMERTVKTKDFMMDGSGGIWRCHPSGNILDYTPLEENAETKEIRQELLTLIENQKLPSAEFYGEERIQEASKDYKWPTLHATTLEAYKNQNNWINNKRRLKE